jgi:hypothetical protein
LGPALGCNHTLGSARRRQQMGGAVRLPIDPVPEDLRPELRHPPDVLHIQRPLRDSTRHL